MTCIASRAISLFVANFVAIRRHAASILNSTHGVDASNSAANAALPPASEETVAVTEAEIQSLLAQERTTNGTDAATAKARSLGAQIIKEVTEIPNIGRFSIFIDPTGAALALFKPKGM